MHLESAVDFGDLHGEVDHPPVALVKSSGLSQLLPSSQQLHVVALSEHGFACERACYLRLG